jgi:hypothetical protein
VQGNKRCLGNGREKRGEVKKVDGSQLGEILSH